MSRSGSSERGGREERERTRREQVWRQDQALSARAHGETGGGGGGGGNKKPHERAQRCGHALRT